MPDHVVPRALLDIVAHAYAGVLDPARWANALQGLARLLDARAAGVRVETMSVGVQQEWVGLEPGFERAYLEHYWQHDPWAARIWEAPVGSVARGNALAPRRVVEASAFYNELALPHDLDDLTGGVLERSPTRSVTFAAMKGAGHRFTDDDTRLVALVAPHIAQALALRDRLQALPGDAGPGPRPSGILLGPDPSPSVEARLRTLYGLTAAEARVAVRIGRGLSPKEIASELGSSWYTVRSQLRHVFEKTDKRTQSALARLVTLLETSVALEGAVTSRR